jgi:hypothetical protein
VILTTHLERILRAACVRPVRVREFTEGAVMLQVAPRYVVRYFEMLERAGLMYSIGAQFYATEDGRGRIADKDAAVAAYEARSRMDAPTYTGERWTLRPGAEDHKRWPSKGIDAGRVAA